MKLNHYAGSAYRRLKDFAYYYKNKSQIRLSQGDYRRLKKFSQNSKSLETVFFNERKMKFTSPFWFLHSVDEIFVQEVYRFSSSSETPVIIDCGANIGLSVLYFKELYRNAKIIAFEADPFICKMLDENIKQYGYNNIESINAAVWKKDTTLSFYSEGSVGGKIEFNQSGDDKMIEVPTIRLRDYLSTPVDFLKIDIEGAEYEVLKDCHDLLGNVKNLFIEYHVMPDEPQTLHEILEWVHRAGFKYYLREAWNNMTYPYMKVYNDYYQMQLNIFCYK
jgi:FkbM family methyltransferase